MIGVAKVHHYCRVTGHGTFQSTGGELGFGALLLLYFIDSAMREKKRSTGKTWPESKKASPFRSYVSCETGS